MQIYGSEKYKEQKKENRNNGPYLETWQCIVLFLVGFAGLTLVASFIFSPIFQYAFNITAKSSDADKLKFNTYVNLCSYIFIFLAELGLLFLFNPRGTLQIFKNVNFTLFFISLLFFLVLICGSSLIGFLTQLIQNSLGLAGTNGNQDALNEQMGAYPAVLIIETVILAPFVEEITYRQGLFETARRYSRVFAYIVVILVFALIHTGQEIFTDAVSLSQANLSAEEVKEYQDKIFIELLSLPSYAFAGFLLSFAYEKTGSFMGSFFTHSIYNLVVTLMTLIEMHMHVSASATASNLMTLLI